MSDAWWRPHLGLAGYVCMQCGRTLGTVDDMQRMLDEVGDDPRLLEERMPGWAIDLCWRRIEVACTRPKKWASDVNISIARAVFSMYARLWHYLDE